MKTHQVELSCTFSHKNYCWFCFFFFSLLLLLLLFFFLLYSCSWQLWTTFDQRVTIWFQVEITTIFFSFDFFIFFFKFILQCVYDWWVCLIVFMVLLISLVVVVIVVSLLLKLKEFQVIFAVEKQNENKGVVVWQRLGWAILFLKFYLFIWIYLIFILIIVIK